jgi:hypothetical protein
LNPGHPASSPSLYKLSFLSSQRFIKTDLKKDGYKCVDWFSNLVNGAMNLSVSEKARNFWTS